MVKVGDSWNPWVNCRPASTGCLHCFARAHLQRLHKNDPHFNPKEVTRTKRGTFNKPLRWRDQKLILTPSYADWWIRDADRWRGDAWQIIKQTTEQPPHHIFRILTKRPQRIRKHLPSNWGRGWSGVWLGVTAENQKFADKRLDILRKIPAQLRWVSCEPLLEQVNLNLKGFGFVAAGGETGPERRPADTDWFRSIRDQCKKANVPFFFLQHGGTKGCPCHRKVRCRLLDGRFHEDFPAILPRRLKASVLAALH